MRSQLCLAIPLVAATAITLGPVDTPARLLHRPPVTKPRKVEESQASYAAKKPAKVAAQAPAIQGGVRYASAKQTRKAAEEVFKVHNELFRKLAQ